MASSTSSFVPPESLAPRSISPVDLVLSLPYDWSLRIRAWAGDPATHTHFTRLGAVQPRQGL